MKAIVVHPSRAQAIRKVLVDLGRENDLAIRSNPHVPLGDGYIIELPDEGVSDKVDENRGSE